MKSLNIALLALLALPLSAHSATIAIVDSGTDLSHPDLKNVKWTNLKDADDAVDNDDNGYIDDTHGWNFAESNNKLFDKRLLGTFSKDVYTFFEIQVKMLNGKASAAELDWVKSKRGDAKFLSELQTFGNFVHGSHVAGIASQDSPQAAIMGLKLLPTKSPKPFAVLESTGIVDTAVKTRGDEGKKKIILKALDLLGSQQASVFGPIAAYLKGQSARVANCSFGTGFAQGKMLLGPLLEKVFKRPLTEAELNEYVTYFIEASKKGAEKSFIQASPATLFVIAAGNDGTDNDVFPASPANIKAPNAITVAATNGYDQLASFSNFGAKMVDVAAPGVGILSAIPGGEHLLLSGTSQAAPHVANIAGKIIDMNPKLTPAQVREILMQTSDQKGFLRGRVASGGIVNESRATVAASYTLTHSVADAVARAVVEVMDTPALMVSSEAVRPQGKAFVLPLPSLSY